MNLKIENALNRLKEGNRRFSLNESSHERIDGKRRSDLLKKGQNPFVTVLTCADSRVPAEILFDQGLGDIFVIRNAGNILDDVTIGSLEYGLVHLKTPVLIILGHEDCGAVKATMAGGEVKGHLKHIVEKIKPALMGDDLDRSIKSNVFLVAKSLVEKSSGIKEVVDSGELKIVSAYYNMKDGVVEFLN